MIRSKTFALPLLAAVLCLGASGAFARESGEAPRGQDNGNQRGKSGKAIEAPEQLIAREAGEAPRGQDNGKQKGKSGKAIESMERDAA